MWELITSCKSITYSKHHNGDIVFLLRIIVVGITGRVDHIAAWHRYNLAEATPGAIQCDAPDPLFIQCHANNLD